MLKKFWEWLKQTRVGKAVASVIGGPGPRPK